MKEFVLTLPLHWKFYSRYILFSYVPSSHIFMAGRTSICLYHNSF